MGQSSVSSGWMMLALSVAIIPCSFSPTPVNKYFKAALKCACMRKCNYLNYGPALVEAVDLHGAARLGLGSGHDGLFQLVPETGVHGGLCVPLC